MPLVPGTADHDRVMDLVLQQGQPVRILFATNQRGAGQGRARWRLAICGPRGNVGETELSNDNAAGI